MRFNKVGKAYQLVIENGNDLEAALTLDEALWVAMSAPNQAYTCDQKVFTYIDTLKLGSITTESLKRAIRWLLDVYAKKENITDNFDGKLLLSDLTDSDVAKQIRHSAEYILNDLKCDDKSSISIAQVQEFQKILTGRPLNGDGVISLLAAGEASTPEQVANLRAFIEDGVKATGGTTDLDGTQGLTLAQFQEFYDAIVPYLEWRKSGLLPAGQATSELMPFGADTAANLAMLEEHAALIDEFFKLCDLQGFDARLSGQTLESDGKPAALDPTAWPGVESHLKAMPIVQPAGKAVIKLGDLEYINPLYRAWWCGLVSKVLQPILGVETAELTPEGWAKVQATFAAHKAYIASQKGGICAAVDVANLERYASLKGLVEEAQELEKKDKIVADILTEAGHVEKALLYLKWLVKLANNFISFPDLYEPKVPTLFERGRVVIDGRWFNITFPVNDMGAHSAQATNSGLFLIYVEVDTKPSQILCAPVTIGDKGNLFVGKRGIFFAPDGLTYNAKIVKVIENPVCLKEAVFAPFAKFGKMAEDKVAAMSNSAEGTINGKMADALNDPKAVAAAAAPAPAAPAAKDKSGMFMGLGIAFAALSSAFAFICKTIADMSGLSIVISLLCIVAVLVAPIVLLAIVRLRRQDLSSLLEGNGWAINARMRLTRAQRKAFSRNGRFPVDASGTPRCRLIRAIIWVIAILVLVAGGIFSYKYMKSCQAKAAESQVTVSEEAQPTALEEVAAKAADAVDTATEKVAETAGEAVADAAQAVADAAVEAKDAAVEAVEEAKEAKAE
ncbi:MAG: hypothetical protein MJ106_00215 [Lentisphaeria bacterium]|nr:hypothetical protein [Lentisphaeria bacterium]